MAHMTKVLERIAGAEEAACLQMLEECPEFSATLDEAARLWDDRGADYRAERVVALSEIVQEEAPDLVWLYGPFLHLYLATLIKVGILISQGKPAEAEAVALRWRPPPIHLSVGNPLTIMRKPDGSFTCINPEATEKAADWNEWRGFLRAQRPEGKDGRPPGRKDSRPRKQRHSVEPGMAGAAYASLGRGVSKKKVISSCWPDLDNSDGTANLAELIGKTVALGRTIELSSVWAAMSERKISGTRKPPLDGSRLE